jgi:uncharacterized protein (DUF302 family)
MTGGPADNEPGVTTKISSLPFAATVSRLTSLLDAKGMTTFAVIDQRAAALGVGVDLRDTTLVLFGSPAAGTPVMAAAPLAALDLPLKVLIWAEEDQVNISYVAPAELDRRHQLGADLTARLAGIDTLTDALVGG